MRAGCSDASLIDAGAEIITKDELPFHDHAPDVAHALKEPSTYEAEIPMPFCRIGALHTGDFHTTSGLAKLLEKRSVAVFDGSNIGSASDYRIPIRGRMSVFAGEIGSEWVRERCERVGLEGRVVVVGGGYAGCAAVRDLLGSSNVQEVHLFENADDPNKVDEIKAHFGHITDQILLKLNNAFGPTSKAQDWAPEVGVMLSF